MKLAVLNSVKSNLNHIANKSLVDNRLESQHQLIFIVLI